jgi:hypothetical protein
MSISKRNNLFRARRALKLLLASKNRSISDKILSYLLSNLILVIYASGILLTTLVVFIHCVNLPVPFSPKFNIQSSFYPFVILPIVVLLFFLSFNILIFSSSFFGNQAFKEIYKKFEKSKENFKEASSKLFYLFYTPSFLYLIYFVFLSAYVYKYSVILFYGILPIIVGIYLCFSYVTLKQLGLKISQIILFWIQFSANLIALFLIMIPIYLAASKSEVHLAWYIKYLWITVILYIIVFLNYRMSTLVEKNNKKLNIIWFIVFSGITFFAFMNMAFKSDNKVLEKIIQITKIEEKNINIIVISESCSIIKIRAPNIIEAKQDGLCETKPINILFSIGEKCLIDPLEKNIKPFSIPCADIKS